MKLTKYKETEFEIIPNVLESNSHSKISKSKMSIRFFLVSNFYGILLFKIDIVFKTTHIFENNLTFFF